MMAHLVVLALVLFAGSCYGNTNRIVGGTVTTINEYPSIVQIEYVPHLASTWLHLCGGSILNERWILSAAHCFQSTSYRPSRTRVRAGATYRHTGGMVVQFSREHIHPEYRVLEPFDADIAVVRLAGLLTFGPTIQQAAIVAQGFVVPDNAPVIVAGWGTTHDVGILSRVLLYVQVYTVNNQVCRQRYATLGAPQATVTHNMICAGLLDVGGKDACRGDSGGPLYFEGVVVGVVSWGATCADPFLPGVYAAVSSYSDWIVRTARN